MMKIVRWLRAALSVGLIGSCLLVPAESPAEERRAFPCTLEWNPSESPEVTGYAVYYGTDAAPVANRDDVGPATTATFTNLLAGRDYYFYVVAYNELGMESEPSDLVYYTPDAMTPVNLKAISEGGIELQFRAAPGTPCRVEFTPSLEVPDWQLLSEIVADENGDVRLVEPPLDVPSRFYRAVLL